MMKKPDMSIAVSIVDDDAPARGILAEWVSRAEGFHCVGQHGSVEAALATLPGEKPSVVLMDINMPGMSGIELLPRAHAARPDVPVIMITAYGDAETRRKAVEAGAAGVFTKPINFPELRGEIGRRLDEAIEIS